MRGRVVSTAEVMKIEVDREEDDRWIAEVPSIPGVLVYGRDRSEAISKVKILALMVINDMLEHGENVSKLLH